MKEIKLNFNGHEATVIRPENPNGKWIWKTEFLYHFDQAERELVDMGYTRVSLHIHDMYGSYKAVRLMNEFYQFVTREYSLDSKCSLFGFSRGGLYAFNFALFYPQYVDKVYLDAPVLDMRTWPPANTKERLEVYSEYGLNPETIETFSGHPIENLEEYFALGLPTLIVAGGADEVVPYSKNSEKMIDYAKKNGHGIEYMIKPECKHHPHSLEDVKPITDFITA